MKEKKNSLKRYERKWVFSNKNVNADHNQILILLNKSSFFFTKQFADRFVNSIYFDDQNYTSMHQNIDGVNFKKKYRLRWYGNFSHIKDPFFEIKEKSGFEVKKKLFSVNELDNLNLLKYEDVEKIEFFINKNFNFKNKIFPILTTHYLRNYFISENNLIRATIDTDLKSLFLYQMKNAGIIKEFNDIILELKYDLNLDEYVRSNLANISVRLSKNSKFINSAISPPNTLL